jgi:hypothetical protein
LKSNLPHIFAFCIFTIWSPSVFSQKDFLQLDIGTTVYLDNQIRYNIPDVIHLKSQASEAILIGICYQRKINDMFSFLAGTYWTGNSFSYSIKYNWQSTSEKKIWSRSRFNDGSYFACPSLEMPLAMGIEFPLSKNLKHRLAVHTGLNFSLMPSSISEMSGSYITEDVNTGSYYNDVIAVASLRDAPESFRLFGYLRATYYFKIPKLGQWNFFFVFKPQITKNKIDTKIAVMPDTEYEKILHPDIIYHNIQMGIGYRVGMKKRSYED